MAKPFTIKVLELYKVSPPQNSAPPTSLPLTFFDIPWLLFSPSQPLFFYEYPHPTSHFLSTTLQNLKHSLSLTLQHHVPFAGNLTSFLEPNKPEIVYNEGNYVSLTIAESNGDFNHFIGNHPRDVDEFYSLLPELKSEKQVLPLLAIQVTIFSNVGMCIGLAYHHVVADQRTFNNFMKTWASFCKDSSFSIKLPLSYDRRVIIDTYGLEEIFLKDWWKQISPHDMVVSIESNVDLSNMVRATFVVTLIDMERIKQWIIAQCKKKNMSQPVHLSAYVLTCAFIWVCVIKTRSQDGVSDKCFDEDPNYFGFIAGGITRLDYPVPTTYLGNCVGFGRSMAIKKELLGEDGIIIAAKAIGNTIKKLDKEFLGGAEKWILDWKVLFGSELHVMVTGSPKVNLYETDFGWGMPRKIEEISIDKMRAISLNESRDMEGGIEVGIALPKAQMDAFSSLFNEGLKVLQ